MGGTELLWQLARRCAFKVGRGDPLFTLGVRIFIVNWFFRQYRDRGALAGSLRLATVACQVWGLRLHARSDFGGPHAR